MKRLGFLLLCLAMLSQAILPAFAEDDVIDAIAVEIEAPEEETRAAEVWPEEVGELDLNASDAIAPPAMANELSVAMSGVKLGVKEQYALDIPGAKFKSSKKSVATVDKKGVVTAQKEGRAVVTATVDGEEALRCEVQVLAAPKKVTLSQKKLALTVDETAQLTAKLPKKTASNIEWSSNKSSVAQVDQFGVVTAVGKGKAKITARTFNGRKATCTVYVYAPGEPTSVRFGIKTLSLGIKESVIVPPLVNEGAKATFNWSTKNKKIASVTKKGVITGRKKGTTKITVTTQNGLKATLTVKVKKAPSKVTVSPKKATLAVGKSGRLKAKLPKDTASQITWESSNTDVAAVTEDGTVFGCTPGKARITGRTYNGRSAYCDVTVTEAAGEGRALREKLLNDWGQWRVTEVVAGGIHATTCGDLITLTLREDSTCYLLMHKGKYTGGEDLFWTVEDGQLVVTDGSQPLMTLQPDEKVKKLALTEDDATLYFTQGIDPAPYYYPKQGTVAEDVNGKWVADAVAFAVLGLKYKAEDIGYEATLEIQDETVRLRFPDGGKMREYTMKVWYPGDGLYPWESEDRDIVYCYSYIPELDNMHCVIQTDTQDNVGVFFRRCEG